MGILNVNNQNHLSSGSYSSFSVYVQAHPDDFQFFRGEYSVSDSLNGGKVLFITVTCGDSGRTDGWWQSREHGSRSSIEYLSFDENTPTKSYVSVQGHSILKYSYENGRIVSYYLRLPDGSISGNGYPTNGNQSLQKLNLNQIPILNAIDGSTSYTSWQDLKSTIYTIISNEKPSTALQPWINVSDYDLTLNPGDHTDHHNTSLLVYDILSFNKCFYLTYCTKSKSSNLSGTLLDNKQSLYLAYLKSLTDQYQNGFESLPHCIDEWNCWGTKSYSRNVLMINSNIQQSQPSSTNTLKNTLNYLPQKVPFK